MTNTVPTTTTAAGEIEHLRELVYDLGEALTHLTAKVGQLSDRIKALEADTPEARQLQYEADLAAVLASVAAEVGGTPKSSRCTRRTPGPKSALPRPPDPLMLREAPPIIVPSARTLCM
jgi:hypothetical protein